MNRLKVIIQSLFWLINAIVIALAGMILIIECQSRMGEGLALYVSMFMVSLVTIYWTAYSVHKHIEIAKYRSEKKLESSN